eukprot:894511-Rhodomonas_salina.3
MGRGEWARRRESVLDWQGPRTGGSQESRASLDSTGCPWSGLGGTGGSCQVPDTVSEVGGR